MEKGFIMYSRDGYMCADLVNPDRPKWVDPQEHPTTEEKFATAGGTFAYCGRYEIDVKNNRLVHLPEVATGRGYEGNSLFLRRWEIKPTSCPSRRVMKPAW